MNFDEEILTICKMVDTINGDKKGMIDKYVYLTDKLSAIDYARVESKIHEISVGLEPTIDVKCNNCGVVSTTTLPFRPDFFLPKIKTGGNS